MPWLTNQATARLRMFRICKRLRMGQLGFSARFFHKGTGLSDGTDFDVNSVGKAGALLGDGDGFVDGFDVQEEIAADGFLGFGEGPIDDAALFAGDDAA